MNNDSGGAGLGNGNNAFGFQALTANTDGETNNAFGMSALFNNVDGEWNNAFGFSALGLNVSGSRNTAIGDSAGRNIDGNGNVCIGEGVLGEAGVNNSTYVRNVNTLTQNFSAGVNNYVTVRLSDGRLGNTAVVSSQRYKEDIKPIDKASEALLRAQAGELPSTRKEFDPTQASVWADRRGGGKGGPRLWCIPMTKARWKACATRRSTQCC